MYRCEVRAWMALREFVCWSQCSSSQVADSGNIPNIPLPCSRALKNRYIFISPGVSSDLERSELFLVTRQPSIINNAIRFHGLSSHSQNQLSLLFIYSPAESHHYTKRNKFTEKTDFITFFFNNINGQLCRP